MAQRIPNLATERIRAFIGRAAERRRIAEWVGADAPPTRIVAVTGLGGIGKSTLLAAALQDAEQLGARTAWIDGRAVFGRAEEFLKMVPAAFLTWLGRPDSRCKWVLGIDNYEALTALDGWLRHDLLADAPANNLLIVTCTRNFALSEWRLDLAWAGRVEHWPLAPFTVDEVGEFLRLHRIPNSASLSPGVRVPLVMAVYADWYHRRIPDRHGLGLAQEALSASLVREVADSACQSAIDALCFVSAANLDFLNAVTERPLGAQDYRRLGSLSFVTPTPHGLSLHDVAAAALRQDFRRREPERFRQLRARVIIQLADSWTRVGASERGRIAHDLVQLACQDLAQWNAYADVAEDAPGLEILPYTPEDADEAIACLADWGRPAIPMPLKRQETLFAAIANDFPESVRMVRDPSGEAVGVFSLLPCSSAASLLHRVVPDLASRLYDHPALRDPAAETQLVAAVGMRTSHPLFPVPLLAGAILRHCLEISGGQRMVGLVIDERFKVLLDRLGFVRHPFALPSTPGLVLFVLDLSLDYIPGWAVRLTGAPLKSGLRQALAALSIAEFRRILRHYHDDAHLDRLLRSAGLRLSAAQLRDALIGALGDFGQARSARSAALIRQSYLDRSEQTRIGIAEAMHMSRATYHRRLQEACKDFLRFLQTGGPGP